MVTAFLVDLLNRGTGVRNRLQGADWAKEKGDSSVVRGCANWINVDIVEVLEKCRRMKNSCCKAGWNRGIRSSSEAECRRIALDLLFSLFFPCRNLADGGPYMVPNMAGI